MLLVWTEVPTCLLLLLISMAHALNVSLRCMQDTHNFLLELSKDKPAQYAALSKSDQLCIIWTFSKHLNQKFDWHIIQIG